MLLGLSGYLVYPAIWLFGCSGVRTGQPYNQATE